MPFYVTYQTSIAVFSLVIALTTGQCPQLEASDLGSVNFFSNVGLIATALTSGQSSQRPDVQLDSFTTVCLSSGGVPNSYSSTSVVASYTCSLSGHAMCDGGVSHVSQFHFQCDGLWFVPAVVSVTDPADAHLDTPLRTDCALCTSPLQEPKVDNVTHCFRESSCCPQL